MRRDLAAEALRLREIVNTVERNSDPEEARAFSARAANSFQRIEAVSIYQSRQ